ncbi:SIR2 family protein [Cellulomonas wangsupingiae]|uniref:SIR2 family protein n=1 Tax=Cellulomonas wangsupingiae TaxID=2968085 RepID=UPI001D0F17DE|nr:SIR2 family protein [Cellulomonas wangsupingiae]MCM0638461.1 SIR2 family protein [Cellulomonas wangsupingiae]
MNDLLAGLDHKTVRRTARSGRYQLVLGAGASADSTNARGTVPMAGALVSILAARFPRAPIAHDTALHRAYQRAVTEYGNAEVYACLREIYFGTNPAPWMGRLTLQPWRRVWTLNVDDVFERAFRHAGGVRVRDLEVLDWTSPYSESSNLQVVHIHGHVHDAEPADLIFSVSEYMASAQAKTVWFGVMADILASEPVVIIGARMLDDPDMESMLLRNRPTHSAPSLIVDPYVSADRRWELEHAGYVVVPATAEEFVAAWSDVIGTSDESPRELSAHALAIQFQQLETHLVPPPPRNHDIYSGDHPHWSDAVANKLAIFDWMRREIDVLQEWIDGDRPSAMLRRVYTPRLSGVTAGLYVVAREMIRHGAACYIFDRSSRWDVEQVVDLVGANPTLLIVDGAADFGDDIDRTLKRAQGLELPLCILASDAREHSIRLEGRLGGSYIRRASDFVGGPLSRRDRGLLVQKLSHAGRLGTIEGKSEELQSRQLEGLNVFAAMMRITRGENFDMRLRRELGDVEEWMKRTSLLLGMAAQGNRLISVAECARAVRVSPEAIVSAAAPGGPGAVFVEVVDDLVYARQREGMARVISRIKGEEWTLDVIRAAVLALAPRASREALRRRNRASMLVGHLLTFKRISEYVKDVDAVAEFYTEIQPYFGEWSARYWEQRALCSRRQRRWSPAESFAGRAVQLQDDAYTRTTFGSILMACAVDVADYSSTWEGVYERAEEQYRMALKHDKRDFVSALSFLRWCARLAEALNRTSVHRANLDRMEEAWNEVYVQVRIGAGSEPDDPTQRELEVVHQRWRRATDAGRAPS